MVALGGEAFSYERGTPGAEQGNNVASKSPAPRTTGIHRGYSKLRTHTTRGPISRSIEPA